MEKEKFNQLASMHYNALMQHCSARLGNKQDAADLVQEVFLSLWEQRNKLVDNNLKAWLWSVTNNKIRDYYKAKQSKNNVLYLEDISSEPVKEIDLLDLMEHDITDDEINFTKAQILSQLSKNERELFEKAYIQKNTHAQIARTLGISEGAITVRLFRLRNKIYTLVKAAFTLIVYLLLNY